MCAEKPLNMANACVTETQAFHGPVGDLLKHPFQERADEPRIREGTDVHLRAPPYRFQTR